MVEPAIAIDVDERELREKLRGSVATRALADGCFTRIEGGLSNRAWRLEAKDERWFVRLGHPQAARLGVDRRSECVVLRTVAAAGLAPGVHVCEPAQGLLITRFIEGRTWSAADARSPDNLRRIAACMRRLHELPVPDGVHEVDYGRQAGRLAAALPDPDATGALLAERAAAAFARVGDGGYATTLCHNDLHHLNVLDDGDQLWLVDWEYGGRGNPLFDVASFLTLHDLGPGPTEAFLESYGRLRPGDRGHLDDARWLFDYVQWLWYRSRFLDPVGDEAWYAERLAQRLLRCNN
jgi:aminoglycoside phosphotransferase (APT) family kinase protein